MQFDETGNRKRKYRYGDEDEIEMEQSERKRRLALNKEFKAFAEKIADAATESVCTLTRIRRGILTPCYLERRTNGSRHSLQRTRI